MGAFDKAAARHLLGIVAVVALGVCLATAIAQMELSTFWFSMRLIGLPASMVAIAYAWPRPFVQTHAPRLYRWSRVYFGVVTVLFVAWVAWCAAEILLRPGLGWDGLLAMTVYGVIGIYGWGLVGYTIILIPLWALWEGALRVKLRQSAGDV